MKNFLSHWFGRVRTFAVAHKVIASISAVVLVWGGWHAYTAIRGNAQPARYVVGTAQKGTLVVPVSGTGQVSASNQVDVKSKTSGDVVAVRVTQGQAVKQGAILAQLDAADAQRAVRDAQIDLQSAQVSLEKLKRNQDFDHATTTDDLEQAYRDALNQVSTSFLDLPELMDTAQGVLDDLPDIMDAARDVVYEGDCGSEVCRYGYFMDKDVKAEFVAATDRAERDQQDAKTAYEPNFRAYRALRLDASREDITVIIQDTEKTVTLLAQALKSEQNILDMLVSDINAHAADSLSQPSIPQQISTRQDAVASAIGTTNSTVSGLSSSRRSIQSSEHSLIEGTFSDPLDIATQENVVQQRLAALQDARVALAGSSIRAPFDGVIAKVSVKRGDSVSTSGAIATIVTTQQIAMLTFNEVDVAKIAVGQPTTLTFDAVPDLTIAGQVVTVDTLGEVSQGVVTYAATIAFATQDSRVKPGMSTSASIATQVKTDVLWVPASAVKTQGGQSYVLIFDGALPAEAAIVQGFVPETAPRQVMVQTGLSNDTQTEVVSGLDEGAQIVTRTISSTTTTTATAPSLLNATGTRGSAGATGGGTFRSTGR